MNAFKYINLTIFALFLSIASYAIGPVTGATSICVGTTTALSDTGTGGSWSSSSVAIATINSASGMVTAMSAGTVTLTYTEGASIAVATITVNAIPVAYGSMASGNFCAGSMSVLLGISGSASGVNYQLYYGSAVIGSPVLGTGSELDFGFVTLPGIYTVLGTNSTTACSNVVASTTVNALPVPASITAPMALCYGTGITATDTSTGGTWSIVSSTIASVNATGVVTPLSVGTAILSYTLSDGCATSLTITVNPAVPSIGGLLNLCTGTTVTLGDATSGGTWSSTNPAVGSIIGTSGAITAIGTGSTNVYYTLPSGCFAVATVSVNLTPAPISGPSSICSGSMGYYSTSSVGGAWASAYTSIATIGTSSGIATGVAAGATVISYTSGSGCVAILPVTVNALPSAISGPAAGCMGGTINLTSYTGGTWSSSNPAVATIGSSTGTVSCINPGSTTITYTLASGCAVSTAIAVNTLPASYAMSGGGSYCSGGTGVHIGLAGSTGSCTGYQLYYGGSPVGAVVTGTGGVLDFGSQTMAGSYNVLATNSCTGCSSAMTGSAAVAINALPNAFVFSHAGTGGYCAGGAGGDVVLSGSNSGVTYQLYKGGAVVETIPGTGLLLDFGAMTTGTYNVVAVNAVTGCASAMTGTVNLFAVAAPTLYTVIGGSYCSGGAGAHISLAGSDIGVTYQLYLGITTVGGPVSGTGSSLDLGIHTTGTYSVVATNTTYGCTATMGAATIATLPLPVAYAVSGGGTVCAGDSAHVILSNSTTGISYQVYNGATPVGISLSGTGTAINFSAITTGGTYTVIATNPSTTCSNNMTGSAAILFAPLPAIHNVTGGGNYCSGGIGVHIVLDGSDAGINYQLYNYGSFVGSPIPGTGATIDFGSHTTGGTYTVVARNTATSCTSDMSSSATVVIEPLPNIYTVTGGGGYCPGTLGDHVGVSSSATGVNYKLYRSGALVDSTIGTGTAIDFGLEAATGTYTVVAVNATTGCSNNMASTANVTLSIAPTVFAMAGGGSYCAGGAGVHVYLAGSVTGTTYQLYNGGSAVGGIVSGTGFGLDFGAQTTAGVYTVVAAASCTDTMASADTVSITSTVAPSVSILTPGDTVCAGASVTFTAIAINGGTAPIYQWIVNGVPAAIGSTYSYIPATGDVVSVAMTSGAPCASPLVATASITMNVVSFPTISGPSSVCIGGTTTLSSTAGGTWTSSDPSIATIAVVGGTPGVVTGIAAGSITCSYTVAPGCTSVQVITVNTLPAVTAAKTSAGCGGEHILTGTGAASYAWSPATGLSCTGCSITNANPSQTVVYTLVGTDSAGCSNYDTVSVDGNRIKGYITYGGGIATDSFKVWLIHFNLSDSSLIGIDSAYTCMAGGIPYYEFNDVPVGNYMVKARLLTGVPGTSGYIPTYSLSSSYWYSAASVAHTNTSDNMNISMVYGLVPTGPGFIGGLISTGAGRGTTTGAPIAGMTVYLKDAISGQVLSYTYTDAAGAYGFTRLSYGSYIVYPEDFGYTTTPSVVVALADFTDTAANVDFREHPIARTITPFSTVGIKAIANTTAINIYPNPAKNNITVKWSNATTGTAEVKITDVTGREVYTTTLDVATGDAKITLNGLQDGIYLVTVRGENINLNSKLVIQH